MIQADTRSRKLALLEELKSCSSLRRGKEIHAEAVKCGNASCHYFATTLIKMYAKCRSMADARQVFDGIKHPDVVSWTALIMGYADNGEGNTALDLFARMKSRGCAPNTYTFVAVLKACTTLAVDESESGKSLCLERGRAIHSQFGYRSDVHVQNSLINLYAKCGSMREARESFDRTKVPNVVSWNVLMLGYAENGEAATALEVFARMRSRGTAPNSVTFVAVLKACGSLGDLERGKEIHSEIGFHSDVYLQNTLMDMYAKCRSMSNARQVFDSMKHRDVVSWNTIVFGYAENGEGTVALDLFSSMKTEGCLPDSLTFVAALKACSSLAGRENCLERGKQIHAQIGGHWSLYVQNSLISMYAKCGSMTDAVQVFDSAKKQSVVTWNALISGYADNGEGVTALSTFARMKSQGYTPNTLTFAAVLKACGMLGAFECGSRVHSELDAGTEPEATLVTCLVDFYAKCGNLVKAQKVLDSYPKARDLTTWNALIAGYSRLGDADMVFRHFEGLGDAGFRPDGVTFLSILMCCSHAGLVDKGRQCFQEMSSKHGIAPTLEHYTCMVDILGRSNMLSEGLALLQSMPHKADVVAWTTLLGGCYIWKNVEIAEVAFRASIELDEANASSYVVMAQIYRSRGMWKEQARVLAMREELKAWKQPGESSWTNEQGQVHSFV